MYNKTLLLSLLVLIAFLITAQSMWKPAFGQSSPSKEAHQQLIERFRELGEERWMKDCENGKSPYIPKIVCDDFADLIKKQIDELEQNQTSNSVTGPITYETHNDYTNGFSVEYPSDWHVGDYGKIFKGTREFRFSASDDPKLSLLDTNNFGQITFEVDEERNGVKITNDLSQINLGNDDEPALTYTYTEDGNEIMTAVLMHNSIAYTFKYLTLKENFDKDFDTMMHFFETVKFQE